MSFQKTENMLVNKYTCRIDNKQVNDLYSLRLIDSAVKLLPLLLVQWILLTIGLSIGLGGLDGLDYRMLFSGVNLTLTLIFYLVAFYYPRTIIYSSLLLTTIPSVWLIFINNTFKNCSNESNLEVVLKMCAIYYL